MLGGEHGEHGEPAAVEVDRVVVRGGDAARGLVVAHPGIAFDTPAGSWWMVSTGWRRSSRPNSRVEVTVFTEVEPTTFDVLDTRKRRNAADVLAIEGEKSTRTV